MLEEKEEQKPSDISGIENSANDIRLRLKDGEGILSDTTQWILSYLLLAYV